MKLTIVGAGAMGQTVAALAGRMPEIDAIRMAEPMGGARLGEGDRPDVLIDFSHRDVLEEIASYLASQHGAVGAVLATTGYTAEDEARVRALAQHVPVIRSANFSHGICAMRRLVACAAQMLGDCSDMEIVEAHHRRKADAPSGTAMLLADACDPDGARTRLCGRQGMAVRHEEIGLHSVRGGTVFGTHTVLFAMEDEQIEIRHTAESRTIFARGAVEAALWLRGRSPGLYTLDEVFSSPARSG